MTPDESRAMALVLHDHPEFIPTVRTIPPTPWEKLPEDYRLLAESTFEERWGRKMEHDA